MMTTGFERLRIRNFRVLRDVELDQLTPLTVLLGHNGSGKSTVLDAIRFVGESVTGGLDGAVERRGGLEELRSRDADGPIEIQLGCRVDDTWFDYVLAVDDESGSPVVARETLRMRRTDAPDAVELLDLSRGSGNVRRPDGTAEDTNLVGGKLAIDVFANLAPYEEVAAFHRFVTTCHLSNLSVDAMRKGARPPRNPAGLDPNGANLALRVRQLQHEDPEAWRRIAASLRRYVPGSQDISPIQLGDGSYVVRLAERDHQEPVLPESISDGTLLLLGYLVALHNPNSVLLLEEPENQVHPRLHYLLAEDARDATSPQVIIATHAPRFVDALRTDEVRLLYRDESGYSRTVRASDQRKLTAMVEAGGALGDLWAEGYFDVGDPLVDRS